MPQRAKREDDDDDAPCIKMSIAHAVTTHSPVKLVTVRQTPFTAILHPCQATSKLEIMPFVNPLKAMLCDPTSYAPSSTTLALLISSSMPEEWHRRTDLVRPHCLT